MIKNNFVYLLGGFMVNDNYGDVIQAKFWVDWYRVRNIPIRFLCYEHGIDKCKKSLGLDDSEMLSSADFLERNEIVGKLHLYGGGYLNKLWAGDFVPLMQHAYNNKLSLFATGVQVDKEFVQMAKRIPVYFVSVRDELSRSLVEGRPFVSDDSFGYFLENQRRFDFSFLRTTFFKCRKVLLQLSLNSYVYHQDDRQKMLLQYRNFIQKMRESYEVVMCSSFPDDIEGILENERLIKELGLNINDFSYITTMDFDIEGGLGYELAVVNSFHTYIAAINKFGCAVYYLAFSDYYKQKAVGLKNYGLLFEDRLISEPVDMSRIPTSLPSGKPLNRVRVWRARNSFSKVTREVERIVTE